MKRPAALSLVAAACVLPRLGVLLHERGDILASFTEKSDDFARTFVDSGTYGFIPGIPSAYTQPLYGWFLIPIYALDRHWLPLGLAQIAVSLATALVVWEVARRAVSERAGLVAALVATLNPYLIWHDVHVNREILDQLLAVAIVLLTLVAAKWRSLRVTAALGAVLGLAILGNTRLLFLPLVVVAYLAWRWGRTRLLAYGTAALAGACALVILPWPIRNAAQVGCFTLTTDTRALWKANNEHTYGVLARGGWIDDVPPLPNAPLTPEEAGAIYRTQGRKVKVDECAQMRLYRRLVWEFWRDHPGEKAKLAGQATWMLWSPRQTRTEGRSEQGSFVDSARTWAVPLYVVPLFALALVGLGVVPRRVSVLVVALMAYQTLAAIAFVGATRYRAPWDPVLALLAGPALVWLVARVRTRTPEAA